MTEKLVIGISGAARSGKNLFGSLLKEKLNQSGIQAELLAIASELKQEVSLFLYENFDLDSFSEDTEEKNQFRDLLVWYANLKRKKSNGRYWIDKLTPRILENKKNGIVSIITDVRFAETEKDELFWLKNEMDGLLVFLEKTDHGYIYPPANIHEETNNKILRQRCDYYLSWKNSRGDYEILQPYIASFADWLEKNYQTPKSLKV